MTQKDSVDLPHWFIHLDFYIKKYIMTKKEKLLEYYRSRNPRLECLKNEVVEQDYFDQVFEIAKIIAIEASADIIVKYGEEKIYPAEIFLKYRHYVELNF